MTLLSILTIILIIAAIVLCIALVIYLNRITNSVKGIESNIRNLSSQVNPLLGSVVNLSEKLNSISEDAKEQLGTSKKIITDIKDRVDKILRTEEKIRGSIEISAADIIKNFSAITNGIGAFWSAYKKKK